MDKKCIARFRYKPIPPNISLADTIIEFVDLDFLDNAVMIVRPDRSRVIIPYCNVLKSIEFIESD